jgi:hypothetical protein
MEKERGIGGRKPIEVEYISITYNEKNYVVGLIQKCDGTKLPFVFDQEDEICVKTRNWHSAVRDTYVASSLTTTDEAKKAMYLHNLVMNKLDFEGKGSVESVDHIDGNGFDNRKANLRIVNQSFQNRNTKNRVRKSTKVPDTIDPKTIPRNIWYMPANGSHGERFVVEIKGIPECADFEWKSSSSKKLTTEEKLAQAIQKRNEIFEGYPILKEHMRETEKAAELQREFEAIVSLALGAKIEHVHS